MTNIVEHARIVKQRYLAREVITICERLKQVARDDNRRRKSWNRFNGELDRVNAIVGGRGGMKHIGTIVAELYELTRPGRKTGRRNIHWSPSGFELDDG